jgi:hypothetical protein
MTDLVCAPTSNQLEQIDFPTSGQIRQLTHRQKSKLQITGMSISTEGNGTCWSAQLSSGETYIGKGEPFSEMV